VPGDVKEQRPQGTGVASACFNATLLPEIHGMQNVGCSFMAGYVIIFLAALLCPCVIASFIRRYYCFFFVIANSFPGFAALCKAFAISLVLVASVYEQSGLCLSSTTFCYRSLIGHFFGR